MTDFVIPGNLCEALEVLASGEAKVLAGGTDLMIEMRNDRRTGRALPRILVDVARLPELNRLDLKADRPFIGAGVTFRRIETDPEVARTYPLLSRSAAAVGSVQIRHTGTIGGNAANGSPSADGVTALTALGAEVQIASAQGMRACPIEELITAPYRTNLRPSELIIGFHIDRMDMKAAQCFMKVGRRQAVAVARLNVAVCLTRDLKRPRLVLGSCFPSPRRLAEIESMISDAPPGPEAWHEAGRMAAGEFVNVCGMRSSAGYKIPAIERVVASALACAWSELGSES